MTGESRVVVFGATGMVGHAVVEALESRGALVDACSAPRLAPVGSGSLDAALISVEEHVAHVAEVIRGADAVVNAAGSPDATGSSEAVLMAPNALLPAVIAQAVSQAGVPRFVHVSSAAVQGRRKVLDESPKVAPFSPYSRSKALGEHMVRSLAGDAAVVYRPPGVHDASRHVTQLTARLARSRLSSVARPATSPSAQALLENVGDAIAYLALARVQPASTVLHPWEGLTTAGLLEALGDRKPLVLPRALAKVIVVSASLIGRVVPKIAANARRLEVLWFGQAQGESWLTAHGWQPPHGLEAWRGIGCELAREVEGER